MTCYYTKDHYSNDTGFIIQFISFSCKCHIHKCKVTQFMVWMDNESKALMMSGPQCLYKVMLPSSGYSDYKV